MTSEDWRRHGVFCGQVLPSPITSEGNVLRIVFQSDNSVQKSGFAAVFFTGTYMLYIPRPVPYTVDVYCNVVEIHILSLLPFEDDRLRFLINTLILFFTYK